MRKVFSKIDLKDVTENQFVQFCKSFPKEELLSKKLLKLLSHTKIINSVMLSLLTYNLHLTINLPKKVIKELVISIRFCEHIEILKRIYSRCCKWEISFPKISTLEDLPELETKNVEIAKEKKILFELFPPPPLKGTDTVVPISEIKELRSWSKNQYNCIRHNWKDVKKRNKYFYKIHFEGEEATLEVKMLNGQLKIGDLLGKQNKIVSANLRAHVRNWFDKN